MRLLNYIQKIFTQHQFNLIILGLLFINLFTKFWNIADLQLYGDEAFSVFHAQQDLGHIIDITNNEANPPLYYFVLHFWIKMGGMSPVWLKSLGMLINTIALWGLLLVMKRFNNLAALIFVGICFMASNLWFNFSHELRGYQLVGLWCIWSFYFWLRFKEDANWKWFLGLTLSNAFIPMTHYNAVLMVFVQSGFSWILMPQKWKTFMASYVVSAVLFIPQLWSLIKNVPDGSFWLAKPQLNDLKYVFEKLPGYDKLALGIYIILGLFFIWLIYERWGKKKSNEIQMYFGIALGLFILPVLLNYAIAQYTPVFRLRYVLFSSLFMMMGLGLIIKFVCHWNKWLGIGLAALSSFYFVKQFSPYDRKIEDWKGVNNVIQEHLDDQCIIVVSAPYKTFDLAYYFDLELFQDYDRFDQRLKSEQLIYPVSHLEELKSKGGMDATKVILVQSHNEVTDPNATLKTYFEEHYTNTYNWGTDVSAKVDVYEVKK